MNDRYIAALCLVMVAVLGAVVWQQQANIQDLNHEVIHLQNIVHHYDVLAHNLDMLNQSYAQLVSDIDHFNTQLNQNSTFQTPISKSQAIGIALAYGGWNASSLRGYTVNATLWNVTITPCPACIGPGSCGVVTVGKITEALNDYSPVRIGNTTYCYVWHIAVRPPPSGSSVIPIGGSYIIDAATGEITNCGIDLFND